MCFVLGTRTARTVHCAYCFISLFSLLLFLLCSFGFAAEIVSQLIKNNFRYNNFVVHVMLM